jgi:hypothetical protein
MPLNGSRRRFWRGVDNLLPILNRDAAITIGPLSVAGALALPVLRRALPQVLAGEQNLDRAVRWALRLSSWRFCTSSTTNSCEPVPGAAFSST